ncbi:hypothetical protein OG948_59480 (plasmid) [Embleya sp. NBC_00888]|uniref:hypothetical protein n=1 Tax=Embleya sp. NBC_00888 TaxID=2975960 RepID=UPI002F91A077|nr:hypothetical protein OG948_59480 [Embleya sp. NBC_00888]
MRNTRQLPPPGSVDEARLYATVLDMHARRMSFGEMKYELGVTDEALKTLRRRIPAAYDAVSLNQAMLIAAARGHLPSARNEPPRPERPTLLPRHLRILTGWAQGLDRQQIQTKHQLNARQYNCTRGELLVRLRAADSTQCLLHAQQWHLLALPTDTARTDGQP